jgi:hypothetical protein
MVRRLDKTRSPQFLHDLFLQAELLGATQTDNPTPSVKNPRQSAAISLGLQSSVIYTTGYDTLAVISSVDRSNDHWR